MNGPRQPSQHLSIATRQQTTTMADFVKALFGGERPAQAPVAGDEGMCVCVCVDGTAKEEIDAGHGSDAGHDS